MKRIHFRNLLFLMACAFSLGSSGCISVDRNLATANLRNEELVGAQALECLLAATPEASDRDRLRLNHWAMLNANRAAAGLDPLPKPALEVKNE